MGAFGAVFPVLGPNNGFPGNMSRLAERVIVARPLLATTATSVQNGQPLVIIPTAGGGDNYQSVTDFVGGGGTLSATSRISIAHREVKTNLVYTTLTTIGTPFINVYQPGELTEAIERGSAVVKFNVTAPATTALSQQAVYIRVAVNAAIPAGIVGGFEAVADGTNTVQIPNILFRTGYIDGNGVAEVTMLVRSAA